MTTERHPPIERLDPAASTDDRYVQGAVAAGLVEGGRLDAATRETTLHELLRSHRHAAFVALDDGAVRVPLPDDHQFAECHELPGGMARTAIDFVRADDLMRVVGCWERSRVAGWAQDRVGLSSQPGRECAITIVDVRERYGVSIEVLVPLFDVGASWPSAPQAWLPTPRPVRTAVMRKNLSAVITGVDDRATSMLGWTAQELVGHRSLEFIHPADQERAIAQWLEMRSMQATQRVRVRHSRRDGTWAWVEIENEPVGPNEPDEVVVLARLTDISEEMAAVAALQEQEELFRKLTESLPVGVVQIDRHRDVVYLNDSVATLLGVTCAARWDEVVARVETEGRDALRRAVDDALAHGKDGRLEAALDIPFGDLGYRQYLFTVAALTGPNGVGPDGADGAIVSVTDITDGVRLRERLRVEATHDHLTGCLNRAAILAALDAALQGPGEAQVAVVFLDLDDFKAVNDTAGHAVGDTVLACVGHRLREQAGPNDFVGRLGGDEFLVVGTGLVDDAAAAALAQRLSTSLRVPMREGSRMVRLQVSHGVARAHPGATAGSLVAQADQSMYQAKRSRHENRRTPTLR
jgi:diguanylate cyclase (GGDEF)-like protein/PAS domain S-box-containing protein